MADENIKNLGYRESLEGLPKELLSTLAIAKTNPLDQTLLDIIKSFQGVATLDEIAIRHYRQTNKILDRSLINNRLLALVKKRFLTKLKGKKAVYELVENTPKQESEVVFSKEDDVPF